MSWLPLHPNCRCMHYRLSPGGNRPLIPVMEPDTEILEALDFQPRCQHSHHNDPMQHARHEGPATHWFIAIHCDHDGGEPYMGCAGWAEYVASKQDQDWFCPQCRQVDKGRNMVLNLGPIL